MTKFNFLCRSILSLLFYAPCVAFAQDNPTPIPITNSPAIPQIAFSADQITYDSEADIVTANGKVKMTRNGDSLRADSVIWNRQSGEVRAEGNVRITNPEGDIFYSDIIILTDSLRDGAVENLLLVLKNGGRLAANSATRENGSTALLNAAYTPCAVVDSNNCPKDPTWQITAVEVTHDPARHRIRYKGASLSLLGSPIMALPWLSHTDGSAGGGTGLLVPDIRISRSNGIELSLPYYLKLAPNYDLTITPHVYTDVLPMLEANYRHITSSGAFQIGGYITRGSRFVFSPGALTAPALQNNTRAYIESNGTFRLSPAWKMTFSGRYATDRTFLRRYDISHDDHLRSVINVERITSTSYISIAGWAFQSLRGAHLSGQIPIALPAIDARWRISNPIWDGQIEIQANSLAIIRSEGQDTQRAFASARWDRRNITALGQELLLTAYARGDIYHTQSTNLTTITRYRGEEGWHGRAIGALAAELRWPFVGQLGKGTQQFTPRMQIVASPPTPNLAIPNEDARSVDLEDSNIFSLNRFPGYDRWEDGTRITYGMDWAFNLSNISVQTTIGQSYRLNQKPSILPEGTGLSDRLSDIVGRTTFKLGRKLSLIHRFRIDKDNAAIRRNEIDAVIGGRQTYATIGYLRLNRDIDPALEDLRDREEIRLGGRIHFSKYWSIFGSTIIDLSDKKEDPFSVADGYEPVRHRLGIAYDDDCIELGVTWRRDYETTGDFRRGNTFLFRVALKNLGR